MSAALQNRFGNTRQAELNRAQLRGRSKRSEETLPELAEDVERLTRLAYAEAAEQMVIILAKDQFIDALPDEETRLRITQSRPTSLREALETAMELESYAIASKKAIQVREVHLVRNSDAQDSESIEELLKQFETCVKVLQRGKKGKKHTTAREKKAQPDAAKKRGVCWGCGLPGHNCTKESVVTTTATGNDGADNVGHQGND